jgi:hypothetical protein
MYYKGSKAAIVVYDITVQVFIVCVFVLLIRKHLEELRTG